MKKRIQWLDTLRVFALTIILIYHFYGEKLGGGFLGLEIFFALSAFLITGMAIDKFCQSLESKEDGSMSFGKFMTRRFKRLLPGICLMVFVSLVVMLFGNKDLRVDFDRQLAGVLGFVTNWYEILTGGSYESQFVPHIFLHTWSLAIELHYYILWALVLKLLATVSVKKLHIRGRHGDGLQRAESDFRLKIMYVSLIGIVLSSLLMIIGGFAGLNKSFLYFSDFTRLTPFFYGSLAAALSGLNYKNEVFLRKAVRMGFAKAGLVLLITLSIIGFMSKFFSYDNAWTFRFALPFTSFLSFLLLISANIMDLNSRKVREPGFINIIAEKSYLIYLLHWPLFTVFKYLVNRNQAVILSLLITVVFCLVETKLYDVLFFNKDGRRPGISLGDIRIPIIYCVLPIALAMAIIVNYTSPEMVSLEKDLMAAKLDQDKDSVRQGLDEVYMRIDVANKEAQEELRKEKICFIGDSVTLGLRGYILKNFPKSYVDGKVSRFLHQAIDIVEKMKNEGSLSYTLVFALGNNIYPAYKRDFNKLMDALPSGTRVVVVSPYDEKAGDKSDIEKYAAYLRTIGDKYPYVTLADWNSLAKKNGQLFRGTDGVHFYANKEGIPTYLNLIQDAIIRAKSKPGK